MNDGPVITPNPATESLLKRLGVKDAKLSMAKISSEDVARSPQVRDGMSTETIERYAESMRSGDNFPPLIVRKIEPHGFQVLSGLHRSAAWALLGFDLIPSYIVECDDATAMLISAADNATHGIPLSNAERARIGAELIETHGITRALAAKTVGTSENMIARYIERSKGLARAKELHVDRSFASLDQSSQSRLFSLKSDSVFGYCVVAAVESNWTTDQVYTLVTELNKIDPEDVTSQLLTVGDFEVDLSSTRSGGRKTKNHLGELRQAALKIMNSDITQAVDQCRHTDRPYTARQLRAAGMKLLEASSSLART